jgi:hypothetical protein
MSRVKIPVCRPKQVVSAFSTAALKSLNGSMVQMGLRSSLRELTTKGGQKRLPKCLATSQLHLWWTILHNRRLWREVSKRRKKVRREAGKALPNITPVRFPPVTSRPPAATAFFVQVSRRCEETSL